MIALYAESSAALEWVIGAPAGPTVHGHLAKARVVIASALTEAEIGRTLRRFEAIGRFSAVERAAGWELFRKAAASWQILPMDDAVLARAAGSFPVEPLRTLDAIHLATVLVAAGRGLAVTVCTLDARVRDNARALGFAVVP